MTDATTQALAFGRSGRCGPAAADFGVRCGVAMLCAAAANDSVTVNRETRAWGRVRIRALQPTRTSSLTPVIGSRNDQISYSSRARARARGGVAKASPRVW